MKGLFFFFFTIIVLDPGDIFLGVKLPIFVLLIFLSIILYDQSYTKQSIARTFFICLLYPLIGFCLAIINPQSLELSYTFMYMKALMFFLLSIVIVNTPINIGELFSISTLLLVPITLLIYFFVTPELSIVSNLYSDLESTSNYSISRRAYGDILIDPVVFYKTSPLLLFGTAYLCQKKNSIYVKAICISLILLTGVISGTRANMISLTMIVLYYIYTKYILKCKRNAKMLFAFFFILICCWGMFNFFLVFFESSEVSLQTKKSIVDSYYLFWAEEPFAFIFGQGLGNSIETIRGKSYMLEPTFFEIIRFWGVIGGFGIFLFILYPIYSFVKKRKMHSYITNEYIYVAYLFYAIVELPSNPLFLSSTGLSVMVVVYNTIDKCKRD